ncbi:MAG: hypothetical protein LW700_14780 [Gemmataceae bacterium]|nr:hypothetical protein [Gemmataceae bacterium]
MTEPGIGNSIPPRLEDLEDLILSKMQLVCDKLVDKGGSSEQMALARGLVGELSVDFGKNRELRQAAEKIQNFRISHQKLVSKLLRERALAFQAVAEEAEKTLVEEIKKLPKPKAVEFPVPLAPKPPAPLSAKLLSPQELRDQIARKIQRPPAPPQTTGNIWENWSKNPQQTPPPADEENQP